jgi:transposase-like protein
LKDKEELLTFHDFPAPHWVHLKTTNPIKSTFATVRNRTYKPKGGFASKTILAMSFKLMESAQKQWIKLRGFYHLDSVIKRIKYINRKIIELNDNLAINEQTARMLPNDFESLYTKFDDSSISNSFNNYGDLSTVIGESHISVTVMSDKINYQARADRVF